ncbi:hypothetical protein GO755_08935 [Spirosoma sp. HMF4905]|uniref:Uncharacterized protein n=1 Tax=Spirosoma arboris TaxID=2682092 RepID=A0A7K1S9D7_9BACT|nr:hypothetical protein [Spirosoma arboris]MVM30156.1 hypothetical protein [Spirosoma arboris]
MSTLLPTSNLVSSFLAVFNLNEMPGVVAFDNAAEAIEFLESGSGIDELLPLGVVGWDAYNHKAKGIYWQYNASVSYTEILTSAFQGFQH